LTAGSRVIEPAAHQLPQERRDGERDEIYAADLPR